MVRQKSRRKNIHPLVETEICGLREEEVLTWEHFHVWASVAVSLSRQTNALVKDGHPRSPAAPLSVEQKKAAHRLNKLHPPLPHILSDVGTTDETSDNGGSPAPRGDLLVHVSPPRGLILSGPPACPPPTHTPTLHLFNSFSKICH